MTKYTLAGGRFALGIMFGIVATVLCWMIFSYAQTQRRLPDELYYTLVGATIAGVVAILGQLLVIVSDASLEESRSRLESQALLHLILTKSIRTLNTFLRFKEHVESDRPEDILTIGTLSPVNKPVFAGDGLDKFDVEEITVALRIRDLDLFRWINELDAIVNTYLQLSPVFAAEFENFVEFHQSSVSFDLKTGKSEGKVEINKPKYYRLLDLQLSMVSTAYKGISHALHHRHGRSSSTRLWRNNYVQSPADRARSRRTTGVAGGL